jgi:LacI family transcriptional regulator
MLSITGTLTGVITGTITVDGRRGRVTIKGVAAAAGVSTQTVSRVINARPDVAPETRKRVQNIIDDLGYQPSALARSLIHQRSYTLGVVTAGLKYIGPSRTLNGITVAVEEAGYSLLLKELPHFDVNDLEPIFQALLSRHVDGIIWAVPEVGENRDWLGELPFSPDVPVVHLSMEPRENVHVVSIDNYFGGRLAMSHLLEQGYRHIGHISGPLDWWEARQRKAAWSDALTEAGLECRDEFWAEGNWSSASGAHAFDRLQAQYPGMDAIFVGNDQMALAVMQLACRRDLRIPGALGIVGFDNLQESAFFWPPLTTIQQDQEKVAGLAVQEIIRIIELRRQGLSPEGPKAIMVEPTLIVRESSLHSST